MTAYRPAPEVKRLAEQIMGTWHHHLIGVDLRYVFRDEHATAKGKAVLGRARIVGGLNAYLAALEPMDAMREPERFLVMEIAEDCWKRLDQNEREALIDHELCHFVKDEETEEIVLMGHDVEEFTDVLLRHGLWRPEVERFVEAGKQMRLFGRDGGPDD